MEGDGGSVLEPYEILVPFQGEAKIFALLDRPDRVQRYATH